jgi:hypothetical protein
VPLDSTSTLLMFNEQRELSAPTEVLLTAVALLLDALLQPTVTKSVIGKDARSLDLIIQQVLTSSDESAETLVNTKRRSILRLGFLKILLLSLKNK